MYFLFGDLNQFFLFCCLKYCYYHCFGPLSSGRWRQKFPPKC